MRDMEGGMGEYDGMGKDKGGIHPSEVMSLLNQVEFPVLMGIVKKMKMKGMGEISSMDDMYMMLECMDQIKLELFKKHLLEKVDPSEPEEMDDDEDAEKKMKMREIERDMLKFSKAKTY